MTFHRYDPETCGGARLRRRTLASLAAGFALGAGLALGGTEWLASSDSAPGRIVDATASVVGGLDAPAEGPARHYVSRSFIREPAPAP